MVLSGLRSRLAPARKSTAKSRPFDLRSSFHLSRIPRREGFHTTGQRDFGLTFARAASFGASSRQRACTSARSMVVSCRFSIRILPSTITVSTLSPLAVYTRL